MTIAKSIPNGAVASLTHAGLRSRNEDRVIVVTFPERLGLPILSLLAVADGVGGGEAGEVASEIAIQGLQERVNEFVYTELRESPDLGRVELQRLLGNLLRRSLEELGNEIKESSHSAATTLTAALLCEGFLVIGHVGDTRLYLVNRSGLEQLTTDHKSGDDEAPRCLGTPHLTPEIDSRDLSGDVLVLLCSDGVSGTLPEREIVDALRSGESVSEGVHSLVEAALAKGAEDNCSAAVAVQGSYQAALPATGDTIDARPSRFSSEAAGETESLPLAVTTPTRRAAGHSTAASWSWIPLAILGGMVFCLAALLWLLWPDLTDAVGWTKPNEEGRHAVSPQAGDAPAEQSLDRLRQRQVTQARIIGTLQDELEEAEATGAEGQQRARDLEEELAKLRSQQRETETRLADATKALEREVSAQRQVQAELSTVRERLEASESQREARAQEERRRLQEEIEVERERCAWSFSVVLGRGEGVPASEVFDMSARLLPVDTESGKPLVVLVGADRGHYFEVLLAKEATSGGDRPLEVFSRRQRSRYQKQLATEEQWTFFLLTGYGYARLGEPAEQHVVTEEYEFLLSLPHLELAYREM